MGPFYDEEKARTLMLESGYAMKEDAGRGWRRVVPSPEPMQIVQLPAIRKLVESGALLICVGGGGIPVLRSRDGSLSGTAAVIDKDLAAARLALDIGADALLVLTDVPGACLDYRGPNERALGTVTAAEMRGHMAAGQFASGSMGPKVEACLRIADAGGVGIIASLTAVSEAVAGRAGTRIVPDEALCAEPEWVCSSTLVTWKALAGLGRCRT
ncbi:MAG: hypothetical protein FJ000_06565 [Actinobacteria bacterium]|nr:hypothetical protein [Actinomycetota bacterium]